ncbi:putative multidrug resistance protein isoform X2 [Cryptomeria japonica]|nr:putative multidrug resistance protein isoform X2 [Cryptomeria japonica]
MEGEMNEISVQNGAVELEFAVKGTEKESKCRVWKVVRYADKVDVVLMILGTLGALLDGMSTPAIVIFLSGIVNTLGGGKETSKVFVDHMNQYTLYYVYTGIAVWMAAFLEGFCWTRTGERQAFCIRTRYLKAVLRQDVGFFDNGGASTSQVITTISKDTLVIQDVLSEKVPSFLMNTSLFVFSYAVSFYLCWKLALVAFPFLALLIIPGLMYGRILMGLAGQMHTEYDKAGNIAEQALSSIRTVYSFVGEKSTKENYSAALNDLVKLGSKQGLAKGLAIGSNGVTFAIWAFLSWYASRLVMYEGESGGRVFATGLSFVTGGLALGTALPNLKYVSEACVAANRIDEMIERVPAIDFDDSRGQVLEKVYGELDFKDVVFAYPTRPHTKVLNNFCLNIPGGQTVALVGSSGSGKSTAIALLERFYDPVAGDIMVDEINIKNFQLRWWRNQIGLVSQEPALFATSILENMRFGNEGANMEDIVAATMAANAHNFITQLPDGYNTQVGEEAIQLSGGQKQRIAIARAMLKNPPILLLDEATSALDAASEKVVQQALDRACMGRTTVVVAHRLSTIQNANKIVVVQMGQVIESGLHEDLIDQSNGVYNMLWSMQQHATIEEDNSAELEDRTSSTRTSNLSRQSISNPGSGLSTHLEDMSSGAKKASGKPSSFCKLLALTAPEWKKALVGSACALVYGAVQPICAFVLGSMISAYFLRDHQEMKSKIRSYDLVFFSLFIISFMVNAVQHYNFAAMGELIAKRIRESLLAKVLTFEVGWYDQEEISPGAICSMLANEVNVVKSLVADRISLMIHTSTAVILATALGMAVAWRLAIVMIAVQPLTTLCYYTRKVLLQSMSKKSGDAQKKCSQIAAEAVANHRTITAFCSSERVLSLFRASQIRTRKEAIKQSWLAGIGISSAQSLTFLTWGFDYWYGGRLVHQGLISPGDVFKTYFILVSTGRVIAEAGSMTSDLAKGSAAFKSVFEILDRVTKINPDDPQGTKPLTIQGDIEFKSVDFAYPARPRETILKDFNLKVSAGSSIALVGPSGSGKSTIIALIERFYDPLKGTITIYGMDIKSLNLRCLRKHIALVGQEPVLFAGSIRDNILYGSPSATEAEIVQAATAANAHHFISNLKDGYETKCGDRGMQLSGGQKQRIAIARAIIKNPRILLLDEATSALDGESEKMVQAALDRVKVGRTTVLVAHRLNTIWAAQSVAVLHNGVIVERGTPPDLMSRRGAFYDLLQIQQQT